MNREASADYVAGYVDANGRFKAKPRPSFSVSGPVTVLNLIRDAMGVEGRLRVVRSRGRVYWRLECSSYEDLAKVVKFFDSNPLLARAEEYEEFKKALKSWRPRAKVPDAVAEAIRGMYEDGLPLEVIAERVDLPLSSVASVVYKRYRLKTRLGDRDAIAREYLSGKAVREIAEERGLRASTVYEVLRKKLGMSVIEGDVIAAIKRKALTVDEIAERLGVTPNALSPVLGRLAARGLVKKVGGKWRVSGS